MVYLTSPQVTPTYFRSFRHVGYVGICRICRRMSEKVGKGRKMSENVGKCRKLGRKGTERYVKCRGDLWGGTFWLTSHEERLSCHYP